MLQALVFLPTVIDSNYIHRKYFLIFLPSKRFIQNVIHLAEALPLKIAPQPADFNICTNGDVFEHENENDIFVLYNEIYKREDCSNIFPVEDDDHNREWQWYGSSRRL